MGSPMNKLQWNFKLQTFLSENVFQNVVSIMSSILFLLNVLTHLHRVEFESVICRMSAILSWRQCVNKAYLLNWLSLGPVDRVQILAFLVDWMDRAQFHLWFGHFTWLHIIFCHRYWRHCCSMMLLVSKLDCSKYVQSILWCVELFLCEWTFYSGPDIL